MKRPTIVMDTNVLVSAILFGGKPREVLAAVLDGRLHGVLSLAILDELRGVLQRRKFAFTPNEAAAVIEELRQAFLVVTPAATLSVIADDPDDDRILECAVEAAADRIVSGDPHLLDLGVYRGIPIVTPARIIAEFTRPR